MAVLQFRWSSEIAPVGQGMLKALK